MRYLLITTFILLMFAVSPAFAITPDWIKNTAGWWATDAISENEFINAIEFLIKENIIQVKAYQTTTNSQGAPDWIKNTAGWWATDAISENEFINAIEFLINNGVIDITSDNCVEDFLKYFNNKEKIIEVCDEHESNIFVELTPNESNIILNNKGFRGDEFSDEKSENVYRIFMVGGSGIVSSATPNEATIPSILQKMFDMKNLDLEVEVINAGLSGGNTITEWQIIESQLVNYDPDLIIMYDGWNDLSADYTIGVIINKWGNVCKLGYEEKFDVVITLQPIAGFGNKILTQQEKINSLTGKDHNGFQLIQAKSTYDWLERQMQVLSHDAELQLGKGVCESHDLRNIFDRVNGAIYWDQGHILHAGNLILAEKFFEISMKKIDPLFNSDEKITKTISNYNNLSSIKFLFNEIGIGETAFQGNQEDTSKITEKKGDYFELKEKIGLNNILVGKDLQKINLTEIDLRGQDLSGANLSGHDLRDVDLLSTVIRNADLSYANLEGKDLSGMDLRGIDFTGANLTDVNFTDAIFSKTIQVAGDCMDENSILNVVKNFRCISVVVENEGIRTNFENADLTNAKFGTLRPDANQMIYFANFENADLTNAKINSVQFFGCDFSNSKLNDITAKQMFIVKSDFSNSEMKNFQISESWFQSTSFHNTDMRNGDFDSITFIDVDFSETEFQGTEFTLLNEFGNNNYSCKNGTICNDG
jgi:uncharacterized protein YjbI with pentapeptide repeats